MPSEFERERERVIRLAKANPRPCIVCDEREVIGIGTWIPDQRYRLAAGGNDETTPVFAFWLCADHAGETIENQKLIRQKILRTIR